MSNRKLLLADDSVTIQKVINLTFVDEGIDVMAVGDGDTAMERFYDFRPDIVLADVNMPGLNGYRICENLRHHEDTANIPVILLVGSFESFDENEARRVGANDWLTKPFQSIRQLVTKVSTLLDQAPVSSAENLPAQVEENEPGHFPVEETLSAAGALEENEDIDDLYRQSFTKTAELPQSFRHDLVLGDAGMDDDMIETSHVETPAAREFELHPIEDTAPSAGSATSGPGDAFEIPADETANEEQMMPERSTDAFEMIDEGSPSDADILPTFQYEHSEPEGASGHYDNASYEEPVLSYEDQSDLEKGFELQTGSEAEIVAQSVPFEVGTADRVDEIDPLDIPSTGGIALSGDANAEDIVTLDDLPPTDDMARKNDISPEFVEAVARKVIEKISENVIRQIAWQVVPQVAESVLREKTGGGSDQ